MNDVSSNPIAKENAMDAMFRIKMVRFELMVLDRSRFIFLKQLYTSLIKPIFAGITIIFKYIVLIPFGRLLLKKFPGFAKKLQEDQCNIK